MNSYESLYNRLREFFSDYRWELSIYVFAITLISIILYGIANRIKNSFKKESHNKRRQILTTGRRV